MQHKHVVYATVAMASAFVLGAQTGTSMSLNTEAMELWTKIAAVGMLWSTYKLIRG